MGEGERERKLGEEGGVALVDILMDGKVRFAKMPEIASGLSKRPIR